MIDLQQTAEFPKFVKDLQRARTGDAVIRDQILSHGREAIRHLETMRAELSKLGQIFHSIAKSFTKEERRIFRLREPFPTDLVERIIDDVMQMAVFSFKTHPYARRTPKSTEIGNTFIFRHCLCGYMLALDWSGVGGATDVRPEKIRNDVVDANFATYATFFDGFLSGDQKAVRIYDDAMGFLVATGIVSETK